MEELFHYGFSRKGSHIGYEKHLYSNNISLASKYQYRKKSRMTMKNQELTGGDRSKKKKNRQLYRSMQNRQRKENSFSTLGRLEKNLESGKNSKEEKTSYYPFRWQCKNEVCLCDSKSGLSSDIKENLPLLFEVTMLSDSNKLQDVESAQYKAGCWVLYDDPYDYDLADEEAHKKRIQRYILAVIYFAMLPEKWDEHFHFLSSRSECDWNSDDDYDENEGIFIIIEEKDITYGCSCDEDGNLILLNMRYNNLGGTIVEELSGLRMLEELNLFGNSIHRSIPSVLGRLSKLRHLNLALNHLTGTIPPQLFVETNLEELHLASNRLEGTIPETIGNLQKLSLLYLESNNLSGSIPDIIYSLKRIRRLDLSGNKMSSSISTFIGNMSKLERLDLGDNMLTGQIPSTIGSLSSLREIRLSYKKFSGTVPSTIGNMTLLEKLALGNNKLYGPIPESIFDLPLHVLQLEDNGVTDSIPDKFCDRFRDFRADCRNDVFEPEVGCSCCFFCKDETPIWNGDCADNFIKVVVDHRSAAYGGSNNLEWSLTNDVTGKEMLFIMEHIQMMKYV